MELTITSLQVTTTVSGVSLDDIPTECIAVLRELVVLFEPIVSDIDWENATIEEQIIPANRTAGITIPEGSALASGACEEAPD